MVGISQPFRIKLKIELRPAKKMLSRVVNARILAAIDIGSEWPAKRGLCVSMPDLGFSESSCLFKINAHVLGAFPIHGATGGH